MLKIAGLQCNLYFYGDVLFVLVVCSQAEQALNSEQVNGTFMGLTYNQLTS